MNNWFYLYDENYSYTGAILAEECPTNATVIQPIGFKGTPTFNPKLNIWEGERLADYLKKNRSKAVADPKEVQKAQLVQMLVDHKIEIDELKQLMEARADV